MTTDCSLNHEFSTWKFQAQNMLCTCIVLNAKTKQKKIVYTFTELVVFLYWTLNLMNNLLSYCGLVGARIDASDRDLPVPKDIQ